MEEFKKKYKNMSNAKKIITSFIKNQVENVRFNNEDIELLIKLHPTKNTGEIEYLTVMKRPPYNQTSLYYKSKGKVLDDVSYILCLKVIFDKYDVNKHNIDNIMRGFRDSISQSKKKDFYTKNIITDDYNQKVGICELCSKQGKIEIDHKNKPFQQILDEFILKNSLILDNIKAFQNGNNYYEIIDKDIEKKWIDYHDDIAQFRFLCRNCNGLVGMSGYMRLP